MAASDVLSYALDTAAGLRRVAEAGGPMENAPDARVVAFRGPDAGTEHFAIVIGGPKNATAPLARIHLECFTGDLLGSVRCDCGSHLRGTIRRMSHEGSGVLLCLAQEGRGPVATRPRAPPSLPNDDGGIQIHRVRRVARSTHNCEPTRP